MVGLWAYRSTAPRTFRAAEGAITHLAFSPSGVYLVVADSTNVVRVWDLFSQRAVVKTARSNPVRAVAAGPNDDLVLLADGKSAELWHLDELVKQP
jgi:WD40 repeat protein